MCLSIPSKIVEIEEDNSAIVETMGVRRKVSLDLMADQVNIGDYVLIHIGFAMGKIDEEDALESLQVYEEMIVAMDEEERQELIDQDEKVNGEARETPLGDNCPNRTT